jgi:hypothetical protein
LTLKRGLKVPITILLFITLLVPAYISLVLSSSGYIRINGTSASVPNQQVQAGDNVNLYFGDVTWSGSQLYLLLSQDDDQRVSGGDVVYTPLFSLSNLTSSTTISNYTTGNGAWLVGNNWINGSIPPTTPVGNYYIKVFDDVAAGTATTDTYITVYSVVNASLQISPPSGPGGVTAQFTGSGYPQSANVTIAYYEPTFGTWNYLNTTIADPSGNIAFTSEIPDLRNSLGIGDYPETYTPISYRAEINGIVYGYADYNQYSRGLKRIGNQIASGLFGNGTNLATTVNVKTGDFLALSGKWFHSSSVIYVRWDGFAVVGTVTSDGWRDAVILNTTIADSSGSFETSITIPDAEAGEHYIAIEDSETIVIIKIFMSRGSLQISPSSGPGGVTVQFTGSGYPASTSVTIAYQDPTFGTWNYLGATTANASGSITFATEIPDLRKSLGAYDSSETYDLLSFRTEISGSVYCYADYNQYLRGLKKVGSVTATGLYGNGTNLVSTVTVKAGDTIALSGKWFHSSSVIYVRWDGAAVVGTLTTDEWRNAVIIGTSIASSTGSFESTVTIPTAEVGEHYVAVEDSETIVIIKISLEPSPTPTPTPTPAPTPSPSPPKPTPTIDVSCKGTATSTGLKVEIKGNLSYNGAALSGESVLISYSVTGGSSWESLTSVNTGSDGGFIAVWTPSVTGNYLIKAKWEGNSEFNEATTIANLALTPYSEQNVFSVTSNSTITEFAFNSTSKELSFTVSGPSNTTGYVKVYIPKSLISDISDLKVYVDGNLITYNSKSQEDSWIISFSYSHSEHKVIIDLSAASSKGDETPNDFTIYLVIIAIAVVIAVAVATIVFKRKRQHIQTR